MYDYMYAVDPMYFWLKRFATFITEQVTAGSLACHDFMNPLTKLTQFTMYVF